LTTSKQVGTTLLKRGRPHPKIGNDMQQKPPREDVPSRNRYYTKSNAKWVHIEFTLQEWMHAKYNKILFNLGGCA
jgi:hypothetical protein